MAGMNYGALPERCPDDLLWTHLKSITVRALAGVIGADYSGLARYVRERGFVRTRGNGGRLTHAPCRVCSASTEVEVLTAERECPVCVAPAQEESANVLTFRRELAARRDKIGSPEWKEKYQRVGSPDVAPPRRRAA